MMEGHTGMQQTAAESTLFARQTGLAFHRWPFLGHSFGDANYSTFAITLDSDCICYVSKGTNHNYFNIFCQ